jgi:hypothetical protein
MAQSALTVTAPNPTPPTNFSCTGATPPNPPNFTRQTMNDPKNWSATNPKDFPPPYYDDGSAGSVIVFATNTAALASGTSAADNNTGTTPGTAGAGAGGTGFNSVIGTYPGAAAGVVPASTSVAHEGAGTETSFTQSYSAQILAPIPLVMVGCGPVATAASILAGPNASHASTLSPTTNPTLTSLGTPSSASGASGTYSQTVTGTNFTRQSVIYVNGVPQTTTFISATSLTAPAVTKKTSAGTWPVTVVTGGVVTTAPQTWTFT